MNRDTSKCLWQDGFGILPWNYEPGFFSRLLGHKAFSIDSDAIYYQENNKKIKICDSDIRSVDCSGKSFKIETENDFVTFRASSLSPEIAKLILRLTKEFNEYSELMSLNKIVPEIGFAYFHKAFAYRGDAYSRAVDIIIKTSVDNEFSDLHFEPIGDKVKISYRQNGKLRYMSELAIDDYEHFLARSKYLANCNSQIADQPQEGAFKKFGTDIRFSTFPTDLGERASFRIIGANKFKNLQSLGWDKDSIEKWLGLINEGAGLYLITGSVGSGKTTAMYATLSELLGLANGQLRAVTIEDPVEAFISGICQSSLDPKSEKNLASAFKHLLRQDPDVIALGEIRDVESIVEALQAGLSGHLVFATFHAGSAEEAIDRIKMMATGNKLILSGLKAILHLKLTYVDCKVCPTPRIKKLP